MLSSKMACMVDVLRTVFIYQEDYHKSLKTAHPQRLAFRKQCPRSIYIEYCIHKDLPVTHTNRQINSITLRLRARVNHIKIYAWPLHPGGLICIHVN